MNFIDFEDANITLNKPVNMTDEQCQSVRAYKGADVDNFPYFLVKIMPSKEDLATLNAGDGIYLKVVCDNTMPGFPPVALFTMNDNGEANP